MITPTNTKNVSLVSSINNQTQLINFIDFMVKKISSAVKNQVQNITDSKVSLSIATFLLGALLAYLTIALINKNYVLVNVKQHKVEDDKVIAKVNGSAIYASEVDSQLARISPDLTFDKLQGEGKQLVVNEVAAQKILQKKVISAKYHDADEVTREILLNRLGQDYLLKLAAKDISKKEVKEKYDELAKELEGKEEFKISHILVANQKEVAKVLAEIKNSSFEQAAAKLSLDKKTGENGGDLGYIPENIMVDEFRNNVKNLQIGQVSKPFKSQVGWHIVKLTDRRAAQVAEFKEVKDRIRNSLAEETKRDYIKKLLDKSKIEIVQ